MNSNNKIDTPEHLLQITAFWNWLPAFRVVAETEHLPSASEILGVSGSALSRMIKLLEEHLNYELFVRTGRGIKLTREGSALLKSVRHSMRTVHHGLMDLQEQHMRGPLRVSSLGLASRAYVIPAALTLRTTHPDIIPVMSSASNAEVKDALLKGALDIAFTESPILHQELVLDSLSHESHSVYCGAGHPLYGVANVSLEEVVTYAFCGPVRTSTGASPDGWPAEIARKVVLFAKEMHAGIQCCASGVLLGVLPDAVARQSEGALWRVPVDVIPPTSLFVVRRASVSDRVDSARVLLNAVRSQIEEVNSRN